MWDLSSFSPKILIIEFLPHINHYLKNRRNSKQRKKTKLCYEDYMEEYNFIGHIIEDHQNGSVGKGASH